MINRLCALWQSLLHDPANRGRIYNDFINEKTALVKHLIICRPCLRRVKNLMPQGGLIRDYYSMTDQEFATAIRELWNLARQQNQTP